MTMKNEFLQFFGFSSAMGATVIETPISEQIYIFGLTGNDMAFIVAFFVGVSTIVVNYRKDRKLQKEAKLLEIRIRKMELSEEN